MPLHPVGDPDDLGVRRELRPRGEQIDGGRAEIHGVHVRRSGARDAAHCALDGGFGALKSGKSDRRQIHVLLIGRRREFYGSSLIATLRKR